MTKSTVRLSLSLMLQGLLRNGNEESMAAMFLVPSETAQFSDVKRVVDEQPFQVQNETEIVPKYFLSEQVRPALCLC